MRALLVALLAALGFASGDAGAVIAFDASSEGTGTTTLSWTHTPVGTPAAVAVFAINFANADVISGCTYGGVTMLFVQAAADSAGEPARSEAYTLDKDDSIPTGAQTVTCTVTSGSTAKHGIAFTMTGTAPSGVDWFNSCNQQGDAADPNCTVTGLSGYTSYSVGAVYRGNPAEGDTVAGSGYTLGPTHDFGAATTSSERRTTELVQGNNTVNFTVTNDDNALIGLVFTETFFKVSVSHDF